MQLEGHLRAGYKVDWDSAPPRRRAACGGLTGLVARQSHHSGRPGPWRSVSGQHVWACNEQWIAEGSRVRHKRSADAVVARAARERHALHSHRLRDARLPGGSSVRNRLISGLRRRRALGDLPTGPRLLSRASSALLRGHGVPPRALFFLFVQALLHFAAVGNGGMGNVGTCTAHRGYVRWAVL